MNNLINCVLLIDDDRPTNFYNSKVISKHNSFANIQVRQSGEAALKYLINVERGIELKPNLIFLDINMPAMNGWEFLTEYSKLNYNITNDIKVILLTTSSNVRDIENSKAYSFVEDLINKPLSSPALNNVVEKHFLNSIYEKNKEGTFGR